MTADYTQVFGRRYLLNRKPPSHYADWPENNALDGEDGWFTPHYGGLITSNPRGCHSGGWLKATLAGSQHPQADAIDGESRAYFRPCRAICFADQPHFGHGQGRQYDGTSGRLPKWARAAIRP